MASECILLVQLADIGDLVLTTPAIAALREAHPQAQIDLLATERALPLVPDGLVNRLIPFVRGSGNASREFFTRGNLRRLQAMRKRQYDALILFHHFSLRKGVFKFWLLAKASGAGRIIGLKNQNIGFLTDWVEDEGFGARHQAQYWLDLVALLGACDSPRPAMVKRKAMPKLAAAKGDKPRIVIHTGSGGYSEARRWSPEGFAAVANALQQEHGAEIVLVGQPEDDADLVASRLISEPINLVGATSLPQLADVISGADLFIGADSGVMHIAQLTLNAGARGAAEMAKPARSSTPVGTESRLKLLGVPVDAITYSGWMDRIGAWIRAGDGARHVCTVNPEFIMIAQGDPIFFNILNRAEICVPDGIGLLWASRHVGAPLPERVTGSDGVPLIARHAAQNGWKLYLLGAAEGVAERAARFLREQHPQLLITGVYGGSPDEAEEDEIVARINASGADILLVAYGAPQQDLWIARNLPRLEVSMAMGVGGALDFIAGVVPRAPYWMRDRGMEWLYRLLRQPWRLRRMLRLPRFAFAVLQQGSDNEVI